MSVTIGPLEFPSGKAAVDYTRNLITELGKGAQIPSTHPNYQFFTDLLNNHEDVPRKIGSGIVSFGIQRNKRDQHCLETFVLRTDGTKETFSWVSCAKKQFMTPEQLLYKALRNTIEPQIHTFRRITPEVCKGCKQHIHCSVDHKSPTFYQLTQKFLSLPPNNPVPTTFRKQGRTNSELFKEEDIEFANEWEIFHKENAVLQMLCVMCHKEKTAADSRLHAEQRRDQSSAMAQPDKATSLTLG
jgi:hypothetical protein